MERRGQTQTQEKTNILPRSMFLNFSFSYAIQQSKPVCIASIERI